MEKLCNRDNGLGLPWFPVFKEAYLLCGTWRDAQDSYQACSNNVYHSRMKHFRLKDIIPSLKVDAHWTNWREGLKVGLLALNESYWGILLQRLWRVSMILLTRQTPPIFITHSQ
jgi:hypothetical protein